MTLDHMPKNERQRKWAVVVTHRGGGQQWLHPMISLSRLNRQRLLESRGSGDVIFKSCLVVPKIYGGKLRWPQGWRATQP